MVIEVLFFYFAQRFSNMMSLQTMLYVAALAVIGRWSITAFVTDSVAIYAVQLLHGFTFALTHLLMMRFIQSAEPEKTLPLQSAYNAFAMCIGLGLVMMISGTIFEAFEHWVFVLMALLGLPVFMMPLQKAEKRPREAGEHLVLMNDGSNSKRHFGVAFFSWVRQWLRLYAISQWIFQYMSILDCYNFLILSGGRLGSNQ